MSLHYYDPAHLSFFAILKNSSVSQNNLHAACCWEILQNYQSIFVPFHLYLCPSCWILTYIQKLYYRLFSCESPKKILGPCVLATPSAYITIFIVFCFYHLVSHNVSYTFCHTSICNDAENSIHTQIMQSFF